MEAEAEIAKLQKSLGSDASLDDKYTVLEHAYDQRTTQLNELEDEHEEVNGATLKGLFSAVSAKML